MKYIVVTKNAKIVVTEDEKSDFLKRFQESTTPLLRLKNQLVDRFGIEIYELPFFLKQEEDKLKPRGLRRCRHCGDIVNRPDPCACADRPELRGNNIFSIETPNNPNLLQQKYDQIEHTTKGIFEKFL